MGEIKDIRIFGGGMDSDTVLENIAPGDYLSALNITTSNIEGQNIGSIKNRKGTTLVTFSLPSGFNKCIGRANDNVNLLLYCFIYNSGSLHTITEFNPSANTIITVVQNSILGFDYLHKIRNPIVSSGYLIWTDNNMQPRQFNIQKMKDTTAGATTDVYPTPITEQTIRLVKYPPVLAPICVYGDDTDRDNNLLRSNLYQASYKYIYEDNMESVYSPYSLQPLPLNEQNADGTWNIQTTRNNKIIITIPKPDGLAKKLRIIIRENNITPSDVVTGKGKFFIVDTLDLTEVTPSNYRWNVNNEIEYDFYNDKLGRYLADDELDIEDAVPLLAGDLETVIGENLILANITEGFDNPEIDVEITSENISQILLSSATNLGYAELNDRYNYVLHPLQEISYYKTKRYISIPDLATGYIFYISYLDNTLTVIPSTYQKTGNETPSEIATALVNGLLASGGSPAVVWADSNQVVIDTTHWEHIVPGFDFWNAYNTNYVYNAQNIIAHYNIAGNNIYTTEKRGATPVFGLVYYDEAGRQGGVINNEGCKVKIPIELPFSVSGSIYGIQVDWKIKHLPPVWAKSYQWVRLTSEIDSFVQFIAEAITIDTVSPNNLLVPINKNIRQYKTDFNKSTISEWSFQKGDRIRFIKFQDPLNPDYYYNFPTVIDKEIIDIRHSAYQDIINSANGKGNSAYEAQEHITAGDTVNRNKAAAIASLQEKTFGSFVIEKFDVFDLTSITSVIPDPLTSANSLLAALTVSGFMAEAALCGAGATLTTAISATNAVIYAISISDPNALNLANVAYAQTLLLNTYSGSTTYAGMVATALISAGNLVTSLSPAPSLQQYYPSWSSYVANTLIVEVYRPKKNLDHNIFYEFGQCYPIVNGYHQSNLQNQDATHDATGFFTRGNCFLSNRYMNGKDIDVEDFNYSDFYISPCGDYGRPSAIIEQMERRTFPTKIRHGEKLLDETNINRINQFRPLSDRTKILPLKYGAISGIQEIGYTLKVVMANKIDSIDIQRQQLMAGTGQSSLFISKDLIGSERPTENEYGSVHPMSLAVNQRYLYGWDSINAIIFRDSPNGTIPISGDSLAPQDNYKMISHFKQLSQILNTYDSNEVVGAYNMGAEEYTVKFSGIINLTVSGNSLVNNNYVFAESSYLVEEFNIDRQLISQYYYEPQSDHVLIPIEDISPSSSNTYRIIVPIETICFSEKRNRWTTYLTHTPELFGNIGQTFLGFVNGSLYLHDNNNTRNLIYGSQYTSKIKMVFNAQSIRDKVYNCMSYVSNNLWGVPTIFIPVRNMLSRILKGKFKKKASTYYADFNRDLNSPGGITTGRPLQGRVMEVELECDGTNEAYLYEVGIEANLDKKN